MDTSISGMHSRIERLESRIEDLEDAIVGADDWRDTVSPMTKLGHLAETIRVRRRAYSVETHVCCLCGKPVEGTLPVSVFSETCLECRSRTREPGRRTRQG